MESLEKGYYTANAFNLGDILIDINDYEKRENVVFYPKIFRYKKIPVGSITFWVNEFGSGLSLEKIPDAVSLEEATKKYNENEYYYTTYNNLINAINTTFKTKIIDTDISFIVEITENTNRSEYAQISIPFTKYFQFYLAIFIESIFILQLCRLLERKLVTLLNQRKSYNSQKILTEFASSLFIVEKPQGYLPNHNEFEYMKQMYEAWKIDDLISTIKNKYDLSLTNYKFFLEYDEKRQNALTTLLLGSITVFSINQTIPIIHDAFPYFDQKIVLVVFTLIAVYIAGYTFIKYYVLEILNKFIFNFKNNRLRRRLKKIGSKSIYFNLKTRLRSAVSRIKGWRNRIKS